MLKQKYVNVYAKIVRILAEQSSCDRARVGALLLKDTRIVATGYNGSLPGTPHCDETGHLMLDGHCVRTIHAEQNCILFCAKQGISTENCEMFVTHSPCPICTKEAIQAGISTIYYLEPYRIDENPFRNLVHMVHVTEGKQQGINNTGTSSK